MIRTLLLVFLCTTISYAQNESSSNSLDYGIFELESSVESDPEKWPACDAPEEMLITIAEDSSIIITWDTTFTEDYDYEVKYGKFNEPEEGYVAGISKERKLVFKASSPHRKGHLKLKIRRICYEGNASIPSQWRVMDFRFPGSGEEQGQRSMECAGPTLYNEVPDCVFPVVCGIYDRLVVNRVGSEFQVYLSSPITEQEIQSLISSNVESLTIYPRLFYSNSFNSQTGGAPIGNESLVINDLNAGVNTTLNNDIFFSFFFTTERVDSTFIDLGLRTIINNTANYPEGEDIQLNTGCKNLAAFEYEGEWPFNFYKEKFSSGCSNGLDDDGDGFTDLIDSDCQNFLSIVIESQYVNCFDSPYTGRIAAVCESAAGRILGDWTLSSNDTTITVNSSSRLSLFNVKRDFYSLTVVDVNSGESITLDSINLTRVCPERCGNNFDDDLDGLIDCDDQDCNVPSIIDHVLLNPTCPELNNGTIEITATGNFLNYSIDGGLSYASENVFDSLPNGEYTIIVKNYVSNCSSDPILVTLINTLCDEICDNGIDDDGDGLTDCDDESCEGVSILNVITENPSCNNNYIGSIQVQAIGNNTTVSYSFDGGTTYGTNSKISIVSLGTYKVIVKADIGICTDTTLVHIYQSECFEICGNGIDDDMDGTIDETDDCVLDFIYVSYEPTCPSYEDGVIQFGTLDNTEYSIDDGVEYQSLAIFDSLPPGTYSLITHDTILNKYSDALTLELFPGLCPEICDNGEDDNGNGLIDCEDGGCGAKIYNVSMSPRDCNNLDGSIEIFSECESCLYSIDNFSFQSSPYFDGLGPSINAFLLDTISGCIDSFKTSITMYCDLNCAISGIDTVDCNISTINPSCDSNNDGKIIASSSAWTQVLLKKKVNGAYLTIAGPQTYSVFANLGIGEYSVHMGSIENDEFVNKGFGTVELNAFNACLEICNNGIDDDGDGNIDCADNECGNVEILNINSTGPTCPGNNEGAVSIQANGSNLQYSIDGGNTYTSNSNFINLASGTYTISVRNSISLCETSQQSIIPEADSCTIECGAPEIIDTFISNPTCPDLDNGSIDVSANGNNLKFSIDGGFEFSSSSTFVNLDSGNYSIIVTDSISGCSSTIINVNLIGEECDPCPNSTTEDEVPTIVAPILCNIKDRITFSRNGALVSAFLSSPITQLELDQLIAANVTDVFYYVWISYRSLTSRQTVKLIDYNPSTNLYEITNSNFEYYIETEKIKEIDFIVGMNADIVNNNLTCADFISYDICDSNQEVVYTAQISCENNIDDDGDGFIDSEDPDCQTDIVFLSVFSNTYDCEIGYISGVVVDTFGLANYVVNTLSSANDTFVLPLGNFKFDSIPLGVYYLTTLNPNSGTIISSGPIELISDTCPEICNNGIDDDGDGNIDCADNECGNVEILSVNSTAPSCPGNNDGSISIQANGSNLQYSIDGGNTYTSNSNVINLASGTYNISVRNSISICESSQESIVPDPDPCTIECGAPLITNISTTGPTCADTVDGSITVIASGENLEYSLDDVTYQASNVFNGGVGNYNIYVRNAISACTETQSATINAPVDPCITACGAPIITNVTSSPPICTSSNDGSITFTATGANLEYSIDGGNTYQGNSTFSGLDEGSYDIWVRNSISLCETNSTPVDLTALDDCNEVCSSNPVIDSLLVSDTYCPNSNGSISVFTSSSNVEYSKDDGTTWQSESTFTDLGEASYDIKVRDAALLCESIISTVTVNCLSVCEDAKLEFITADATCGVENGRIILSNDPNIIYSIDNGKTFQSTFSVNALVYSEGTYSISAKNISSNCVFGGLVTVSGSDLNCPACDYPPTISLNKVTKPACGETTGLIEFQIMGSVSDAIGLSLLEISLVGKYNSFTTNALDYNYNPFPLPADIYTITVLDGIASPCYTVLSPIDLTAENCIEICGNGIDDDFDGFTDGDDTDCDDNINLNISVIDKECDGSNNGSIAVSATTVQGACIDCEYSFDGGQTFTSSNVIISPDPKSYNVVVRSAATDNIISGGLVNFFPDCVEICDNGIDDDGDGNIDCEDGDCGAPYITEIKITELSCPSNNDGSFEIIGGGANLLYSIDGGTTYSSSNIFTDLVAGDYEIRVKNNANQCSTATETRTLYDTECLEICGNGIDDDGDGLIDFADDDCEMGFIMNVTHIDATSTNCPSPNDGQITIEAQGEGLEYSIDGIYYQESSIFTGLVPGIYEVSIRNNDSGFLAGGDDVIVDSDGCAEICDNGLDDDGDGLIDCEDDDCAGTATPVQGICDILNFVSADSMAEHQVLITLQGIDQATFDAAFANTNVAAASIRVDYQGIYGFSSLILPLLEGDAPNVESWSADIYDYAYNTDISVTIMQSIAGSCPVPCANDIVFSFEQFQDSVIIDVEQNPEVELPDFECGADITIAVPQQNNLSNLGAGELITMQGFPLLTKTITKLQNGLFSGTGVVALPFNKKTLNVSFDQLSVNKDREVYGGLLVGISDLNTTIDLMPDTFSLGGEICLPPPPAPGTTIGGIDTLTGLDPWGFNAEGINSATGTPYDENGFDEDGNHMDTGSPYNDAGCNRAGRDEMDNPCHPGSASSEFVQKYLDSIKNELSVKLIDLINGNIIQITSDSTMKAAECDNSRTLMNGLINTLGYDRVFILGEEDKYFKKGMNKFFSSKPERLVLNIERNANTEALEEEHISLYECDIEADLIDVILDYLYNLKDTKLNDLNVFIQGRIAKLSDTEIQAFLDDPSKFEAWLALQLSEVVIDQKDPADIVFQIHAPRSYRTPTLNIKESGIYSATASTGEFLMEEIDDLLKEEIIFGLEQGHTYVNGIHRAFYLEKIVESRQENAFRTGEAEKGLMPLKLEKTIGGFKYGIYLDNITIAMDGAETDAFLIIQDNSTGRKLIFQATNLSFGPTGFSETARLSLESQIEIRLSNAAKLILKPGDNFAEMDCTGFIGVQVGGEVEMCRNYLVPVDTITGDTILDPDVLYKFGFAAYVTEWLDFTVTVDAPPFAVAGYTDVKFSMDSLTIDMSEKRTPQINIPEGYASPFLGANNRLAPAWKGFALDTMTVTMPNQFSDDTTAEITAKVLDLVIDGCGVSTNVRVEDLIPYNEGNMGGWPMSIDGFGVKILHNHLAAGELYGKINVPVLKKPMDYEGIIYPGNRYEFTVTPSATDTFSMLYAETVLYDNSKVSLQYNDGDFLAVATLSGNLKIGLPDTTKVKLELPRAEFLDLQVSNKKPYFSPGTWKIIGSDTLSAGINGFGIDIWDVGMFDTGVEGEVGLGFGAALNVGTKKVEITAGGDFEIIGELVVENNRQRWKYKKVKLNEFYLDLIVQNSFSLQGGVRFYEDDSIYGKGVQGLIDFQILKGMDLRVQAAAQFGKLTPVGGEEFKYFFVDALVDLPIDIAAGPVSITGFGGGVSNRMDTDFSVSSITFGNNSTEFMLPDLGESFSGVKYTPNPETGLGIKATALIAAASENVFSGSVTLALLFNQADDDGSGGGLKSVSLQGNGQFLNPPILEAFSQFSDEGDAPPTDREGAITAFMDLTFDFNEIVFTGDLAVFLNTPGNYLTGIGPGGLMCWAEMHFSKEQWFINIGTPDNRCGVKLVVPDVITTEINAYLDVGSKIPDFPGLPSNVRSVLGEIQFDESLRSGGGGFMFGSQFILDIDASIEFAGWRAGGVKGFVDTGFDVMLRNYGATTCNSNNGEQIGIDGWYASGQAWAYVEAKVDVFNIEIASLGVAAVLQAQLPNPLWMRGDIKGDMRIGNSSRDFGFAFEKGTQCDPYNPDPGEAIGLQVINYSMPGDNTRNQPVATFPEVFFSVPINRVFDLSDNQGGTDKYKATLKSEDVTMNSKYGDVNFTIAYENNSTSIKLIPSDFLPANDSIVVRVKVEILKNGSFFAEEELVFSFLTGETFDHIPLSNVKHSYPFSGMYDFFPEEYNKHKGFIQLLSGQPNLFNFLEEGYEVKAKLTKKGRDPLYVDIIYDGLTRRIEYDLLPQHFDPGEIYSFELVQFKEGEIDVSLFDRLYFRVSIYDTFIQKYADIKDAPNLPISRKRVNLGKDLAGIELLSEGEYETGKSSVSLSSSLNNDWYKDYMNPIFYSKFPVNNDFCGRIGDDIDNGLKEQASLGGFGSNAKVEITEDHFLGAELEFENKSQQLLYGSHNKSIADFLTAQSKIRSCIFELSDVLEDDNIDVEGGPSVDEYIDLKIPPDLQLFAGLPKPELLDASFIIYVSYRLPNGSQTTPSKPITINYVKENN